MNLLPDANWLNAFKLPMQVMIGLFIASGILLIFDQTKILELSSFGLQTRPIVIVLAVFSGSLSITGILKFFTDKIASRRRQSLVELHRKLRDQKSTAERTALENAALDRIKHLAPQELRHLANCLREGSQSFYTYVHSPAVTTLMGKNLVYTPGGTHNQDYYPFTISDFAWKHLLSIKDEVIKLDQENIVKEKDKKRGGRY